MGKKKSRTKQVSKGIIGRPMRSRKRHWEEGYHSDRIRNQLNAFLKGKKVMLTGKVKTHDVSKFSNCKETVFNYVKIEQ